MASPASRDMSPVKSVAIVGAGVSGLAAAYQLKSHGVSVTVFEAEERAGGKLKSVSENGLIWDEGANTMTESEPAVRSLIDGLGLQEKQQFPLSQNKRYIVRNGSPQLVPSDPIALIKSNLLSTKSKVQIILEPLLWRFSDAKPSGSKVSNGYSLSVQEFFQRHFGKEVVDYLIDPFVAGTTAGDPESLSVRHAFPELWNLERKFGSIIIGAIRSSKRKENGAKETSFRKGNLRRGSFSFQGGMQTLTDMLCKELGNKNLKLKSKVLSLAYKDSNYPSDTWLVSYASNSANRIESSPDQPFDAVIMTAPLCNMKEMKITRRGDPFDLNFLPKVSYLPLSVVVTSFKKENVKQPLEGFGVLIPSKEQQNGLKTLGTLFSSMMFPDRAPRDQYLFTTFVGGSRNRDLARASLNELLPTVTSDLRKLLGVEGHPTFVKHVFWSNAFPLYGHDYDSVLEAIEKLEKSLPGFYYAGNIRGGLSVGKAIASGCKAADLVISYLNSRDEKGLN